MRSTNVFLSQNGSTDCVIGLLCIHVKVPKQRTATLHDINLHYFFLYKIHNNEIENYSCFINKTSMIFDYIKKECT